MASFGTQQLPSALRTGAGVGFGLLSFIFLMAIDTHSKTYLLTNVGELNKHPQTIVTLHLLIEMCGVPAHRCTANPGPFQVFLTVVYYV